MKKTSKFLLAAAMAMSTVSTPLAVMMTNTPVFAETVTVKDNSGNEVTSVTHTYKAYQIFSGTQGENGILGNTVWGNGVNSDTILTSINSSDDTNLMALKGAKDAADLASRLEKVDSSTKDATAKAFARIVEANLKTDAGIVLNTSESGTDLAAGYYLIVDTTDVEGKDDVKGLSILQLTGTTDHIVITPKNGLPTPDKQVQDETTEGTQGSYTWGETADHAINEEFQFKLLANNFSTVDIDAYSTYYLKFVDSFSKGVTYVGNPKVTIKVGDNDTTDIPAASGGNGGYTLKETKTGEGESARTTGLTVEIPDIKKFIPTGQTGNITVEVTYTAKLNENAVVNDKTGAIENNNTLHLEYSNNPNGTGTGKSEEDKVFVATFKIKNTKKALSDKGNPLAGAGFKLIRKNGSKKEVATFDATKKVTGWVEYAEDADLTATGDKAKGTEIKSDNDGDFSMTGLDAGTYHLVETTTPAGYNTANPTEITISATHAEDEGGNSATVTINSTSKMDNTIVNTIVNTQNGTLPETGGMGTTMIYGVGGMMVVGAAVIYITNKRTRKE